MSFDEVHEFLISILPNDEIIVSNLENSFDCLTPTFTIPSKMVAIEYCDLKANSAASPGFRRSYNRDKAIEAQKLGYKFFLFFQDEWSEKRILVKQMIKYRLGLVKEKVFARKCKIVEYDKPADIKWFFEQNHIDGHTNSTKAFALEYEGKVVSAMSLRTSFKAETEIARFATNCEFVVPGAGSKLINLLPRPIITYSNNRLSSGEIYSSNGFEEITVCVSPSYYYTDFETRIWRYRCKRLNPPKITQELFDQFPSEIAQATGGVFSKSIFGDDRPLYRIEDCGHRKWSLK